MPRVDKALAVNVSFTKKIQKSSEKEKTADFTADHERASFTRTRLRSIRSLGFFEKEHIRPERSSYKTNLMSVHFKGNR